MLIIKLINPKLEILEFISINVEFLFGFNLIQDGGEGKKVPYQFFLWNFYKRGK